MQLFRSSILSITLSTLLIGCGGGGGGDSSPVIPTPQPSRAVNGPLAGATVTFLDCNQITTLTDQDGYFVFPTGCTSSQVHITGGLNTMTDQPFTGILKAPKSSQEIIASPLTTLIQAQVDAGVDLNTATNQVAQSLGLPANLLTADPLSNQAAYTKSIAIQHTISQIKQAISPLSSSIPEEQFTLHLYAALAQSLSQHPESGLTSTDIISKTIHTSLDSLQNTLDAEFQDPVILENLKTNLAALSAPLIANSVHNIEEVFQNIPAAQFSNGLNNIKAIAQDDLLAAKDSIIVDKLVSTLAPALSLNPNQATNLLESFAQAVINNTSSSAATDLNALQQLVAIENPNVVFNDTETLGYLLDANAFYKDYLQLEGISLAPNDFTPTQLNQSLVQPISIAHLNNLLLPITAHGAERNKTLTVRAGLVIRTLNNKQVKINANSLRLSFTNGILTAAVLPANTQLMIHSNLNTIANFNLNLNNDVNVLKEGKVALNSQVLTGISADFEPFLQLPLASETVSVSGVIDAPHIRVALHTAENKLALASKFDLGDSIYGSGYNASFKLQP